MRLFLNNLPLSIYAYHIDATRQLSQSICRSSAENTSACQVIDAIGTCSFSYLIRFVSKLVDTCIINTTHRAEHPLTMGWGIGVCCVLPCTNSCTCTAVGIAEVKGVAAIAGW